MHYIDKFWNHLRNAKEGEIESAMFAGVMVLLVAGLILLIIWGLIEWLGIFIVLVPVAIALFFLLIYGTGWAVIHYIDRQDNY